MNRFVWSVVAGLCLIATADLFGSAECPKGGVCNAMWCGAAMCMCHKNESTGLPECIEYANP